MMLNTKYQNSRLGGYRQITYNKLMRNYVTPDRPFWPNVHNLNKLGRGLLDDAT